MIFMRRDSGDKHMCTTRLDWWTGAEHQITHPCIVAVVVLFTAHTGRTLALCIVFEEEGDARRVRDDHHLRPGLGGRERAGQGA
jgi:hypothetical protein